MQIQLSALLNCKYLQTLFYLGTSRFRVTGAFSSIKAMPKLSKIQISEEEIQPEESMQDKEDLDSQLPRKED